ncbi:MAG: hypothetical protein IAE80_11775 [Anaerolinea sp.]|nr:hypothetical protein [Anaerolinea sp.]
MRHFRAVMSLLGMWILLGVGMVQAQTTVGACGSAAGVPLGIGEYTLEWDGLTREYILYIPASYDAAQPVPLVLSLHGFASSPRQQMGFSAWNEVADAENIIVAYPAGTGLLLRWNSGLFAEAANGSVDDVSFLTGLIDHLAETYCIDTTRVYINGLSNGGGMSYRYACEMADRVAAFGGVAGAYSAIPGGCDPSQPVPVILFHGTDDPIVPYAGGDEMGGFPALTDFAADWAERDECAAEPETISGLPESVEAVRYTGCADNVLVEFYTLLGGGHTWSGSGVAIPRIIAGETNRDIEASEIMWAFFEQYQRN